MNTEIETNKTDVERNASVKNNLQFLKRILNKLLIIIQVIIPVISVYAVWKMNSLTNTANLLQITNVIQARTDLLCDIELKEYELEIAYSNNETIDATQIRLINKSKTNVITSLLNNFEFACQQYLSNKIDRKAFKSYYDETIKYIKKEYSDYFIFIDGRETFSSINAVYKEWHER